KSPRGTAPFARRGPGGQQEDTRQHDPHRPDGDRQAGTEYRRGKSPRRVPLESPSQSGEAPDHHGDEGNVRHEGEGENEVDGIEGHERDAHEPIAPAPPQLAEQGMEAEKPEQREHPGRKAQRSEREAEWSTEERAPEHL